MCVHASVHWCDCARVHTHTSMWRVGLCAGTSAVARFLSLFLPTLGSLLLSPNGSKWQEVATGLPVRLRGALIP